MFRLAHIIIILFCVCSSLQSQSFNEPQKTRFYYDGLLDNAVPVQMNLHIEDYVINGAFIIESTGDHYIVEGRLSGDKSGIGIRVYNEQQFVAAIEAKIISDDQEFAKELEGVYRPWQDDPMSIILKKIAEFATRQKYGKSDTII